MSTNNQSEWPKSFRWHTAYVNEPDIVTFDGEDEIVTDYCGCIWSYSDCISCNAWVPTDQHKQKPPPAPSQDDVKAEVLAIVEQSRRHLTHWTQFSQEVDLMLAFRALADAVERLAK